MSDKTEEIAAEEIAELLNALQRQPKYIRLAFVGAAVEASGLDDADLQAALALSGRGVPSAEPAKCPRPHADDLRDPQTRLDRFIPLDDLIDRCVRWRKTLIEAGLSEERADTGILMVMNGFMSASA